MRLAMFATAIALLLGTLACLGINSSRLTSRLLEVSTYVPFGASAVVLGFGYLLAYDNNAVRGSIWLIPSLRLWWRCLLWSQRCCRCCAVSIQNCGSPPRATALRDPRIFRYIDWPLLKPAIASGGGLAFCSERGRVWGDHFLGPFGWVSDRPVGDISPVEFTGRPARGQGLALSVCLAAIVFLAVSTSSLVSNRAS